ncbi:MAG TPA: hydroxymethylbilane synthase, partial [Planctomycetaceae bacterium]|nr:hydroxymethylbilane synthase [Planctomycetaceae bacterium]
IHTVRKRLVTISAPSSVRIATRGSQLALWQARHIADLIRRASPAITVELVEVSTTGDRVQSQPLRDMGGTGVFTREVQLAVLDGRADLAVHSLKDLPTETAPGLQLAGIPERGVTADALVLPAGSSLAPQWEALPPGARVGTGSPRRQSQLRFQRPDLQLSEIRGNVETRLRKLDDGEYDALVLAAAGLTRLGLAHRISCELTPPVMYPAVSQGAIGLECRAEDIATQQLLQQITHAPTWAAALAERSLLRSLRAGCHAPVGVNTRDEGSTLMMEAVVLSPNGTQRWITAANGDASSPEALGALVAQSLIDQGAAAVL